MKNIVNRCLLAAYPILFGVVIGYFVIGGYIKKNNTERYQQRGTHCIVLYYHINSPDMVAYKDLKRAFQECINKYSPNCEISIDTMINNCRKYNVDPALLLSQGIQESHLGTRGKARRNNNVFAMGSYDYRKHYEIPKYNHVNESIKPYVKVLNEDYLVNGRTVNDLLENFTNKHGKRYASDPNYEYAIKKLYKSINDNYNITELFNNYKDTYETNSLHGHPLWMEAKLDDMV